MKYFIMFILALLSGTHKDPALNIYDAPLQSCCTDPMTGFYRDGVCNTAREDYGTHVVCAIMTDEFLQYTLEQGNDLITPRPEYRFPGLKAGDGWCLCAIRWYEAYRSGKAPKVRLASTHKKALQYIPLEALEEMRDE